jgi:putative oxidoreductase
MNAIRKIAQLSFLPRSTDIGLLALRIGLGLSLFIRHGWEKISDFSGMAARFPDPLRLGPVPSLSFALLSDAICSILIILGIATRPAALISAVNLLVAFSLVHHFALFGQRNGEVAYIYLCGMVALVFAGPGKYSLDSRSRSDGSD